MATNQSTNDAANDTTPKAEADAQVFVEGWASTNWRLGKNPAVIVNPKADPLALVEWAIGQLQQLDAAMNIIHCSHCDLDIAPDELAGIVRQPLEQALTVLTSAAGQMFKAEHAA